MPNRRSVFFFILAVLLCVETLRAAPFMIGFVQEPDDALVSLLRPIPFRLHCLVKGPAAVHWEFRSRSVNSLNLPWIKTLGNHNSTLLVMANISTPGAYLGQYQCVADYGQYGTLASRIAHVDSYENVSYSLSGPENQTVVVGNTVTLKCRLAVIGRHKWNKQILPSVKWTHNGVEVNVSTTAGVFHVPSGDLQISKVSLANTGRYVCSGGLGTEGKLFMQTAYLTVEQPTNMSIPVTIATGPTDVVILRGRAAMLECTMAGYPIPEVKWAARNLEAGHTVGSNFFVKETVVNSSGSFTCFNSTKQQWEGQRFTLTVLEPLHIDMSPLNIKLTPGQTQEVRCAVTGSHLSNMDAAAVMFEWKLNRNSVQITEDGRQYSIVRVRDTQYGILQCRAIRKSTGEEALVAKFVTPQPPVPRQLIAGDVTTNSATITWTFGTVARSPVSFNLTLIWYETPHNSLGGMKNIISDNVHLVPLKPTVTMHRLVKLNPNTEYQVVILAVNSFKVRSQSEQAVTFTTRPAVLSHPQNMTATVINSTAVRVSWKLPAEQSELVSDYLLWYEEEGSGIRTMTSVSADRHDVVVKSLQPYTLYTFVVYAQARNRPIAGSRKQQVRTDWTSLTAKAVNSTTVQLNWIVPQGLPLDAEISLVACSESMLPKRGSDPDCADKATLLHNTTEYSMNMLSPMEQLYYFVISPYINGSHVNWVYSMAVRLPPPAPEIKTILVKILSRNIVQLSWTVNTLHPDAGELLRTEYQRTAVCRNKTIVTPWISTGGSELKVVLKPGPYLPETEYELAVRTITTISGTGKVKRLKFHMPPVVKDVKNFVAYLQSADSILLSWLPSSDLLFRNATHYAIWEKLQHGPWNHLDDVQATGGAEQLVVDGLLEGGKYEFKVVAHWRSQTSEAFHTVTMPIVGLMPRPQHVSVQRLHNNSIELHWLHVPPKSDSGYKRYRFEVHYTMAGASWTNVDKAVFMITSMPSSPTAVSHRFLVDKAVEKNSPVQLRVRTIYLRKDTLKPLKSNFSHETVAIKDSCCQLRSDGLHHPLHVRAWYAQRNTSAQVTVSWRAPHNSSGLITRYDVYYWRFPRTSSPPKKPSGKRELPTDSRLIVLHRQLEEDVVYAVRVMAVGKFSASASHAAYAYAPSNMPIKPSTPPSPAANNEADSGLTVVIIITVGVVFLIILAILVIVHYRRRPRERAQLEKVNGRHLLEKRPSQTKPVLWPESTRTDETDAKLAAGEKPEVSHYATVICASSTGNGRIAIISPISQSTNTANPDDTQPSAVANSDQLMEPVEVPENSKQTGIPDVERSRTPSPTPVAGHTMNDYDEPVPIVRTHSTATGATNMLVVPPNNYTRTGRSCTPPPTPPPPGYSSLDAMERLSRPAVQRSKSLPPCSKQAAHKPLEPHVYAEPDTLRKRSRSGLTYAKLDVATLGPASEEPVRTCDKVIYAEVKIPNKSGRLEMDA